MSAHTPGPWVILPRELHDGQWIIPIETADGWQIAEAEEGNEHLIAAAPDLLEALENLVADADRLEIYFAPDGPVHKAIAKARGEA